MARKSGSSSLILYAIGAYLAWQNWPAISSWFGSLSSGAAATPASSSGTYPNSPVPISYSTSQTFIDSSGNQWQFSTQTGQWVIAAPGPAPASPSAGTVVATAPTTAPLPPVAPSPVAAVPQSAGQVVPMQTAPGALPGYVMFMPIRMIRPAALAETSASAATISAK